MEKQIIMEKNGKSETIDQKKLDEVSNSPDFQVTIKNEDDKTTAIVKERLLG